MREALRASIDRLSTVVEAVGFASCFKHSTEGAFATQTQLYEVDLVARFEVLPADIQIAPVITIQVSVMCSLSHSLSSSLSVYLSIYLSIYRDLAGSSGIVYR